jgi:hypothetical protein
MPVIPCAPVTPVYGIVQYSAAEFLASYPEFTGINNVAPASLANDFVGATFLLNNTCCSRVQDANLRLYLLYLLTAHIAAIFQGTNDAGIGAPYFSGTVAIAGTAATVSAVTSGVLAVGATLYDGPAVGGSLIVPGTTVTGFVSGVQGGIGVYAVAPTQTVIAEAMIVPGVPNVQQPLGIVGRINSASEGDVSVTSEWSAPPSASAAYFLQTKYGAQYWTDTARFRTAIFVPAPPGAYNPLRGFGVGPWGPGGGFNGPG